MYNTTYGTVLAVMKKSIHIFQVAVYTNMQGYFYTVTALVVDYSSVTFELSIRYTVVSSQPISRGINIMVWSTESQILENSSKPKEQPMRMKNNTILMPNLQHTTCSV